MTAKPPSFRAVPLADVARVADGVVRVDLDADADLVAAHVAAGQFQMARLVGGSAEAPFALYTAPHEGRLTWLVRAGEPPSTEIAGLGAGDRVEVTPPLGRGFDLAAARGRDVLFVGAGTGVAPIRAALESVLADRHRHGVLRVLLGVRGPEPLLPPDTLHRWAHAGVASTLATSRHPATPGAAPARVQAALDRDPDLLGPGVAVVAAGPPALLDDLRARVVARGGDAADVLDNLRF